MKKAASMQRKLAVADQVAKEGDLQVSSIIYVRLAKNRANPQIAAAARARLNDLKNQGRTKLQEIDAGLDGAFSGVHDSASTYEVPSDNSSASDTDTHLQDKLVVEKFEEYEKLRNEYRFVPQVSREIKHHVLRQRAKPEFAAILNEPDAKALWQLGRQHERKNQICCAFLVYEKAELLLPAASAQLAQDRLAEFKSDSRVVAAAKQCRKLKWCHQTYARAERLEKVKPKRARELFFQVVRRSPIDSRIHQEALEKIETIDRVAT